ncbi:MAG TPA: division plane positioning ATPase MipZ [Caulobacteraceae bacterium]|nr:division plane positioning ATPase MipZ [Caulobacteraceae bacterium]
MSNRSWWPLGRDRPPPPRPSERLTRTKTIVVGNEKGGAGKTTVASLIAVAMLYKGARVTVIDLDLRQASLSRFFANRRRWLDDSGAPAPMPLEFKLAEDTDELSRTDPAGIVALFEQAIVMAMSNADVLVIDTPGGDTPVSRAAHLQADLVVTPMNDSFVDFDVLGVVDPVSLHLVRPSHYSRVVHDARRTRAAYGRPLDWIVMPNRLSHTEARNRERLNRQLEALAAQVNFTIGPALHERVVYRELFPFGLTVADLAPGVRPLGVAGPREAVRKEVDAVLEGLGLDRYAFDQPPTEPRMSWGR